MMLLCEETQAKYPDTNSLARKLLLPFPLSYLWNVDLVCAVNDLLLKKRNRLDITQQGDLKFKLTKFLSLIKSLCCRHQVQGSH